ncbi:hypothetical protein E1286_08740 [Nonomuraea terrae]|uniref:DUF4115 domain-containing protein n=1 Tax=Nonomuraea terrae TaxID=2530383 RepID=A0A4V2YN37_9ACTN|nr:hypothetical protein [Nonomuraea terrae]TDD52597.1 hypothetical protein E1286_08740 [Nonomuraea terrae]
MGAAVTLLVIGGREVLGRLGESEPARERTSAPASEPATAPASEKSAQEPTVRIECVAETCPLVTVRVPGGDVLQHRDMSRGEEVSFHEPELDVVLTDASTVHVTENGTLREPGEEGARESFTVRAPD